MSRRRGVVEVQQFASAGEQWRGRWSLTRGGARRDGTPIVPSSTTEIGAAVVGLSGLPPTHLGWAQFRALGAAALDLCAVADGTLDGYVDCSTDAHGAWDYLGGLLVCREAGAHVADARGRDLVVLEHSARRTPVAAVAWVAPVFTLNLTAGV